MPAKYSACQLVAFVHAGQTGRIPVGGGDVVRDGAHRVRHAQTTRTDAQREEFVAVLALRMHPQGAHRNQNQYGG